MKARLVLANFACMASCMAASVPDGVIAAVCAVETGARWQRPGVVIWKPMRGASGEVGPWQLAPCVLEDLGYYSMRLEVHGNVVLAEKLARKWLAKCYARNRNWRDALCAYHVGPRGDKVRGLAYADRVLNLIGAIK